MKRLIAATIGAAGTTALTLYLTAAPATASVWHCCYWRR